MTASAISAAAEATAPVATRMPHRAASVWVDAPPT
jgi:hypothetical protein